MENYDVLVEQNEKRNKLFLELFEKWLIDKKLSTKTIKRHISNASFYINVYLTKLDFTPMEKGMDEIYMYFSDFFIRKCMWSTPNTISESCTSIKKFYECMLEKEYVTKEDFEMLCFTIKEEKADWIESCRKYNNGDSDWYTY